MSLSFCFIFLGYMIHECAAWSTIHKKWYFLPRRMSKERYHEDTDPYQGTNLILTTDSNFSNVEVNNSRKLRKLLLFLTFALYCLVIISYLMFLQVTKVGEVIPTHGFSSLKFIPDTEDEIIVALKSEEVPQGSATYLMMFNIKGEIILPETKIADIKYEGIEFI